jgi:hypothetical protein
MNRKDIVSLMEAYDNVASLEKNPPLDVSLDVPTDIDNSPEPEINVDFAELKDIGEESQEMVMTNLRSIRSHAYEVLSILQNGVMAEPWMQEKLAIANDYIVSVTDAIMYRK